jgi:hypothetical protein
LNVLDIVCDLDDESLRKVQEQFPGVKVTKDFNDIINDETITGVAVVTPSHTHFKLVKAMLEAGKNVYVEKPISTVAEEAKVLSELADEKGLSFNKLEREAGLARNSICKWGVSVPAVDKVAAVASVLGTTIDELLRD